MNHSHHCPLMDNISNHSRNERTERQAMYGVGVTSLELLSLSNEPKSPNDSFNSFAESTETLQTPSAEGLDERVGGVRGSAMLDRRQQMKMPRSHGMDIHFSASDEKCQSSIRAPFSERCYADLRKKCENLRKTTAFDIHQKRSQAKTSVSPRKIPARRISLDASHDTIDNMLESPRRIPVRVRSQHQTTKNIESPRILLPFDVTEAEVTTGSSVSRRRGSRKPLRLEQSLQLIAQNSLRSLHSAANSTDGPQSINSATNSTEGRQSIHSAANSTVGGPVDNSDSFSKLQDSLSRMQLHCPERFEREVSSRHLLMKEASFRKEKDKSTVGRCRTHSCDRNERSGYTDSSITDDHSTAYEQERQLGRSPSRGAARSFTKSDLRSPSTLRRELLDDLTRAHSRRQDSRNSPYRRNPVSIHETLRVPSGLRSAPFCDLTRSPSSVPAPCDQNNTRTSHSLLRNLQRSPRRESLSNTIGHDKITSNVEPSQISPRRVIERSSACDEHSRECNSIRRTMPEAVPSLADRTTTGSTIPAATELYRNHSEQKPYSERNIVEIYPGYLLPLCGSQESFLAYQKGCVVEVTCSGCESFMYCMDAARMVLCPICRSFSSVEPTLRQQDILGLGLTIEIIAEELSRRSS